MLAVPTLSRKQKVACFAERELERHKAIGGKWQMLQ